MRFLFILLSILLSACALTNTNDHYTETVTSWRWGNAHQLLNTWGRPNRIARLANGNKVYIYEKESYQNYPPPPVTASVATVSTSTGKSFVVMPTPAAANPPISASFLLTCTTLFEIDPRDVVVDIRVQGNNCTADEGFFMSKSNPNSRNAATIQRQQNSQS